MQQLGARGRINNAAGPQTSGATPDLSAISGRPDRMTDPVTGQGAMDLGPMTNVRTGQVESLPPPNPPGGLRAGLEKIGQAADASRSLVASGDFSGLGNQGGVIVATHPILSARAAGAMLRGTFSEAKAQAITDEIDGRQMRRYNDPDFYARVGLDRTNYLARKASSREEAFPPSIVENVPGVGGVVKASDRAYSIVLDRQRADTFDALYDGIRSVGKLLGDGDRPVSEAEARAIAKYVNIATGRGHFGEGALAQQAKDAMPLLARVLFAPRYQLSRVQHLTGVPLWGQMSPRARAVIAGEYAKYVAAQAAFIGAAQASGQADVDTDPRSTNFLKVKLKNAPLELDPLGSARGYLVLAARLGSPLVDRARGEDPGPNFISEAGDESSKTAVDLVGSFVGNKAAPLPRAVANSLGVGSGARAFQLGPGRGDDGEFRSGEALGLVTAISPRQLVEDIINADGDPQKIQAATASYLLNTLGFQSKVQKDWSGGGDAALAKILAESFK